MEEKPVARCLGKDTAALPLLSSPLQQNSLKEFQELSIISFHSLSSHSLNRLSSTPLHCNSSCQPPEGPPSLPIPWSSLSSLWPVGCIWWSGRSSFMKHPLGSWATPLSWFPDWLTTYAHSSAPHLWTLESPGPSTPTSSPSHFLSDLILSLASNEFQIYVSSLDFSLDDAHIPSSEGMFLVLIRKSCPFPQALNCHLLGNFQKKHT